MRRAVELISTLPLGSRVVVRHRIAGGSTDALGFLVSRDAASCTVRTRTGEILITLENILLAKAVPPAPAPRQRRVGGG